MVKSTFNWDKLTEVTIQGCSILLHSIGQSKSNKAGHDQGKGK